MPMIDDNVNKHPVQKRRKDGQAMAPVSMTMQAYEVYKALYGAQEAMVTGHCRGGFGIGELLAFLYAYPHPRSEWRARVDEAFREMENI